MLLLRRTAGFLHSTSRRSRAPLLRTLECHAGQEEVVLTAALLQPLLGTDVSALAAQPLMQDPSRAIRDAKPTAQDVNDVSCVAHLFHGVHAR